MDHQALLRAVETSDCKSFLTWYEKAQFENNLVVKECVDRLTKKDLQEIWTVFKNWVLDITTNLKENLLETSRDENGQFVISALQILSSMATYTITNLSKNELLAGLDSSVKAINGCLKFVTCKKAGLQICEMCELYWKVYPKLEISLSINVIHWLLSQALQPKAPLVAVKQLWNMKESIEQLNATILQSSGLLDLFLSGLENSKFISSNEGRKCIACLFWFGSAVIQMLQKAMKKQIPLATIADCDSMGDIYYKAWRMAPEECRGEIEYLIQDLMYCAVVAQREPLGVIRGGVNKISMNKLLFHFLHAIHRQKKQRTVAVLIHNLYKPILWRYLEASNGHVRANALCLFFDAFPFESGEGIEEDEVVRDKQWAIMLAALMDPVPFVRTIAIQGTCRILAEYWEIVPINIIQQFITCLFKKLIYDSSSADVRAHAVKGLIIMLDGKQTHGLLEKMIPLTTNVLHDPNEKVRAEYVSMLTLIHKLKVSKLWEVIDVQHLIVRLEVDTSKTVCRRLVILLAPFYHPKSTPEIVFQRCLRFVIDNRMASRKFYQYLHICVGIEQMTQLILIIWKFLRNLIYRKLRQRINNQREETTQQHQRTRVSNKRSRKGEADSSASSNSGDEDKENQDLSSDSDQDEDNDHGEFSEASIMGLIDVVCILLNGNKSKFKTPPNEIFWENIKARFNKTCSLFFRYFRNSDGLRTLIYLYGLLSSSSSPLMLSFVKSQLKSLNDEATPKEFGHLIDVMSNWGRGEDLLESISDHLHDSLTAITDDQQTTSRRSRGKGQKRVSFQRLSEEKPKLGLRCMSYILQHPNIKKRILRYNLAQVEQLCDSLKAVTSVIETNPEKLSSKDTFLFMAASLHVRIVLVLACFYKREEGNQPKYLESQEKISEILNWISRLIKEGNPILGDLAHSVLDSMSNLVMIHALLWKVCHQFLDVVLEMVMRFPSSSNLTLAMSCAYHSLAFIWTERSIGNECDVECDEQVNLLIKFVLECHNSGANNEQLSLNEKDWPLMKEIIRKILEECNRHDPEKHESLRDIVRSMVDTVRQDMMLSQSDDEENVAGESSYLHQLAKAIIAAFRTSNSLAESMMDEFFEVFKNEDDAILPNLVAVMKLLELLNVCKGRILPGTFVSAIATCEHWWSSVGEIEKSANPDFASFVDGSMKNLKKAFSV